MPFRDEREAEIRLSGNPEELSEQEIRDLLIWAGALSGKAIARLQTELPLKQPS